MTDFFKSLIDMLRDPVGAMSILVGGLMIVFALFAVETKKIVDSLIALSAISLLSVLLLSFSKPLMWQSRKQPWVLALQRL